MSNLLASYEALSSTSNRSSLKQVLQSIIDAPPLSLTTSIREKLVRALLDDVHQCVINGKGGRLTKTDAQLALLAVKTLGRIPAGSQVIAERNNLSALLAVVKSLRPAEDEAANEALRCVANSLLLVEEGRTTWIEVHGGEYCVELLKTSSSPTLIFLTSRILFLATASSSSPFLPVLLNTSTSWTPIFDAFSPSGSKHYDIIEIIGSRLDILLASVLQGAPMSREAMTDLLKFTFNLLVHWPKISDHAETANSSKAKGKGKAKEGKKSRKSGDKDIPEEDKKVMGEIWCDRLDGILAPLLRTFLSLPPTSPSPLTAPLTHVLHSLIAIPINRRLFPIWLSEFPPSGFSPPSSDNSTSSSSMNSPTVSSNPLLPSPSSTVSPTSGTSSKDKDREGRGPFDRAISMLTPRISLSSRPSSPSANNRSTCSPLSPSPAGSPLSTFQVLSRAIELLDVAMLYYLPDNIDPDDKSVRERCAQEDTKLEDVLTPLVVLLTRLCLASEESRKTVKEHLIPVDLDRTSPLEARSDTLGRCLRLLASVHHARLKDAVGEMFFAFCDSDAQVLAMQIGYGNAAGYLYNKGVVAPPPTSKSASSSSAELGNSAINPITGMINGNRPAEPEMTQEEKEREAEKLFVLFERLERSGGGENPIKKALHEGKLEKYRDSVKDNESGDE